MLLLELLKKNDTRSKPVQKTRFITHRRLIISAILGLIAFYLSWECNTKLGYSNIEKACYGVFAFLFGGLYIILYLIFRAGTCGPLQLATN